MDTTERGYKIAALVGVGCPISGVAKALGIDRNTVRKHAGRLDAYAAQLDTTRAGFFGLWLDKDLRDAIQKRARDGAAGVLGKASAVPTDP